MKKSYASFAVVYVLFWCIVFLAHEHAQAVPPLPDLTISFVNPGFLKEAAATVGQNFNKNLVFRVSNLGQAAVPKYGIAVVLSANPWITYNPNPHAPLWTGRTVGHTEVTTKLPPGTSQDITISPIQIPDDISWGDYYLTAVVDPMNVVVESNENNNKVQERIFIMARLDYIDQVCDGNGPEYLNAHGKGFGTWKSTMVFRVGPYTIPTHAGDDQHVEAFPTPGLIPVGSQVYDYGLYVGSRAICRIQKGIWQAQLMSAQPAAGPPGTTVTIACCSCCQAQGTKKLYLCHMGGDQCVVEVPVTSWNNRQIVGTIPNVPLVPGMYLFIVYDGGTRITLTLGAEFTVN